jgi:hypothetical protein
MRHPHAITVKAYREAYASYTRLGGKVGFYMAVRTGACGSAIGYLRQRIQPRSTARYGIPCPCALPHRKVSHIDIIHIIHVVAGIIGQVGQVVCTSVLANHREVARAYSGRRGIAYPIACSATAAPTATLKSMVEIEIVAQLVD